MAQQKKKGFRRASLGCTTTQKKHTKRSSVRKQWTEKQTSAALQSVATQGVSGNKAADLHGVPRSTLKDRLSGQVVHSTRPGPKPYLSPTEEAELSSHPLDAPNMGFGKTWWDVKCLVETYAKQRGYLRAPLSPMAGSRNFRRQTLA